jgi:hypothetical protein
MIFSVKGAIYQPKSTIYTNCEFEGREAFFELAPVHDKGRDGAVREVSWMLVMAQ